MKKIIYFLILIIINNKLFSQDCISHSRSVNQNEKLSTFVTSGNYEIDQLSINELYYLSLMLNIKCNLGFYNDDYNSYYDHSNNTIYIGINMMNEILNKYGNNENFPGFEYGSVYPFLIAHEFGHAKAKQMGWNFKTGNTNKKNELFADFCAGMYACYQRSIINSSSETRYYGSFNIDSILYFFRSLGSWDFNNVDFHGTPEDRKIAVIAGYNFASDYIFNYQRNYNTNAIPAIDDNSLLNSALYMLNGFSD